MAFCIGDRTRYTFVFTYLKPLDVAIPGLGLGRDALKLDHDSIKRSIWSGLIKKPSRALGFS